ncbi:hypothetical protein DB313_05665 (plasmid) [Borrelia turcica IST7]|uniref:Uncharacterized protein n=1 Tax=Borrelia turcica IST7 TaxID=1104446 RepID=A0A386PNB7_9SPIR|nr:hypothetical protein [Borrelia turcica]AYE36986.1 hypothetical protein DB313_05665 [Borrelia turcica IST7]
MLVRTLDRIGRFVLYVLKGIRRMIWGVFCTLVGNERREIIKRLVFLWEMVEIQRKHHEKLRDEFIELSGNQVKALDDTYELAGEIERLKRQIKVLQRKAKGRENIRLSRTRRASRDIKGGVRQ